MSDIQYQWFPEERSYDVEIGECIFREMEEKDGDDCRFELVIPGYCTEGDNHWYGTKSLYFTRTLAQHGQNAGKSNATINGDLCIELGMSAPFAPSKIKELTGKQAVMVVKPDTYNNKTSLKVAFINPPGGPKRDELSMSEVDALWSRMSGSDSTPLDAPLTMDPEKLPF